MSPDPATSHLLLDAAMKARREELRMTWANVAAGANITVETLRAIRRGHNAPSDLTKRGIENALLWEPGSVDHVLGGGDPTSANRNIHALSAAGEAKAPAAEPEDELDLESFVPKTDLEKALMAIYRANQRSIELLNEKVDRLSIVRDVDQRADDQHDQQQKGA